MAVQKSAQKEKRKRKALTKRDKAHQRVARVHRAIERKKRAKTEKKKKAAGIRRKKAQAEEEEVVVEMAEGVGNVGDVVDNNEMDLLGVLGIGAEGAENWEEALENKLIQVESKSLDNPEVRRVYGEIGKLFSRYRSGKVPRAFKIIPNLQRWEELLEITRPEEWTSHAMGQAVHIFASNFDPVRAERFYRRWLVPAVRRDLAHSKKLNVHLFEALKKALYKTNAWFKGIMFELCAEDTLLREIKVIESILTKMTIPMISASVAMLKLMEIPPTTATIHYLSALLSKHYTLPKRVLVSLVKYLTSFEEVDGQASVAWQALLLTLVKQYSQSLDQMSRAALTQLAKNKKHHIITTQILNCLA